MQNSSMPRTTVILGSLLIAVGVIGYLASDTSSWTALIPAILGAVLAVCDHQVCSTLFTSVVSGGVVGEYQVA